MRPTQITDERLLQVCGEPRDFICEFVFKNTGSELAADVATWLLSIPLTILIIFLAAFVIDRVLRTLIRRTAQRIDAAPRPLRGSRRERASQRQRATARLKTITGVAGMAASVIVYALASITALAEVGIAVAPLLAGAGAVGIAIAFGAQKLVSDFLSGLFMLAEDQYGLGDWIDTGFGVGQVENVGLRITRVRDVEGTLWHIPNGEIRRVGNMSQEWARTLLDVLVAYDTDIRHARRVIERVCRGLWEDTEWRRYLIEEPEVWGVQDFSENGMTIRLGLRTEPNMQWMVGRELRLRLKEAFDNEGITIPVPQRLIMVRNRQGEPMEGFANPATSDAWS